MPTVMILHAADDSMPARALAEKVRQANVTVVLDKPLGDEVRAAVKNAPVCIVLWSPRSVSHQALIEDVRFARGKSSVIHACMQSAPVPGDFRDDKSVNLTGRRGGDTAVEFKVSIHPVMRARITRSGEAAVPARTDAILQRLTVIRLPSCENDVVSADPWPPWAIRLTAVVKRLLVALTLAFACSGSALPDIRFERLGVAQGLPGSFVIDVAQDADGFLWIADVNDGLIRYDGYEFRAYRHEPADPHSISSDEVGGVYVDRSGSLWVSTGAGLDRYDTKQDRFTRITKSSESPSASSPGRKALIVNTCRCQTTWHAPCFGKSSRPADSPSLAPWRLTGRGCSL